MALKHFWWGPSLDLLWDSCNGALWVEHCCSWQVVENEPLNSILLLNISLLTHGYFGSPSKMNSICISVILTCFSQSTHRSFVSLNFSLQESCYLALCCWKLVSIPSPSFNWDRFIVLCKQTIFSKAHGSSH